MFSAFLTLLATLVAALPGPAVPAPRVDAGLASLSPYPATSALVSSPPPGYSPIFTESLDRHGSRTLSSRTHDSLTLTLVQRAEQADGLTSRGKELGEQVRQLQDDIRPIGVGDLTDLGRSELKGIGSRVVERLPGLFVPGTRAELWSSGVTRATESGEAFREGLTAKAPDVGVGDVEQDGRQLHFDKSDPDYVAFLSSDVAASRAIAQVAASDRVRSAARHVLDRAFTPEFVRTIDDPVQAALSIWNLYAIVPAMGDQTTADFSALVSPADARALGELHDADYFYRQGPSFSGQDKTYGAARVVLDDFFARIEERLDGGDVAGVFRFAHAEELVPFSALIGLPGSTRQVSQDRPYSAADNPWRGGLVSPLGGNVQWDVFRDDDGRVLVRVLQNERQVTVTSRCQEAKGAPRYYRLSELERCLT